MNALKHAVAVLVSGLSLNAYGALIGSELGSLNRTERTSKLREAAQAFTRVRNDLRRLSSSDERVTALRTQPEE